MSPVLERLLEGVHLEEDEAFDLLVRLTDESLEPALAGALLAALRARGETPDEIRGFARAMRHMARRPRLAAGSSLVDTVGTGGDGSGSLNLSTGAGLLAAACGMRVVKHGNRSVSSRCGSADVLEALGAPIDLDEDAAAGCLEAAGFSFLFAPYYHPAMKALAPVRRAMGVRTVLNLLGPITNPAEPGFQLVGAYSPAAARLLADTLAGLPIERAFVVHGEPGWDEATPVGPFLLCDVLPGRVRVEQRDPADYGLARCLPSDLAGGDAAENAARLRAVLEGERGAHRDALVLGAALVLQLTGLVTAPREAADAAGAAIDDGRALRVVQMLRVFNGRSGRALPAANHDAVHGEGAERAGGKYLPIPAHRAAR
jgi:anthranilate phosphoribosyltransferase